MKRHRMNNPVSKRGRGVRSSHGWHHKRPRGKGRRI